MYLCHEKKMMYILTETLDLWQAVTREGRDWKFEKIPWYHLWTTYTVQLHRWKQECKTSIPIYDFTLKKHFYLLHIHIQTIVIFRHFSIFIHNINFFFFFYYYLFTELMRASFDCEEPTNAERELYKIQPI